MCRRNGRSPTLCGLCGVYGACLRCSGGRGICSAGYVHYYFLMSFVGTGPRWSCASSLMLECASLVIHIILQVGSS